MKPDEQMLTACVTPSEVVRLDSLLDGLGKLTPAKEMAKRAVQYRVVTRAELALKLLEMVDIFVTERVRQAEIQLGALVEKRSAAAHIDGQRRVLASLAEFADLVDNIVSTSGGMGDAVAVKALDRRIDRVFKTYGFTRITTVGATYDSKIHEAVEERSGTEHPSGTVLEEVARGYASGEYVLRVARVIVAA